MARRLTKDDLPSSERFNLAALNTLKWKGGIGYHEDREYTAAELCFFERMRGQGLLRRLGE